MSRIYTVKFKSGDKFLIKAGDKKSAASLGLSLLNCPSPLLYCTRTVFESEWRVHCNEYDGWCVACKDFTNEGGVEPDAEGYACDNCGKEGVMGAEQAMLWGEFEIIPLEEEPKSQIITKELTIEMRRVLS